MLILYHSERACGIPNSSHFCCKTEMYSRMAGIEYEVKSALPLNAPKGKLSYIEDGGKNLGASDCIVLCLKEKYNDLDKVGRVSRKFMPSFSSHLALCLASDKTQDNSAF